MDALPLRTVRPFKLKEIALEAFAEEVDLSSEEGLMAFLEDQVCVYYRIYVVLYERGGG